jgi:hypothetical protein
MMGPTFWTGTVLGAGNQALFWVVGHIAGEKWEYIPNQAVQASHLHPSLSSLDEWFQNEPQGFMEDSLNPRLLLYIRHLFAIDFVHRKIGN